MSENFISVLTPLLQIQEDSNYLDQLSAFIKDAESFTSTEFFKRTKKFLATTVAFSLTHHFGYDLEDPLVLKRFGFLVGLVEKTEPSAIDFWSQLFSYSAFMYDRGKIFLQCGNITAFFGSDSNLDTWVLRCDEVLTMGLHLHNPTNALELGVISKPFNAYSLKEDIDILLNESRAYKEAAKSCSFFERKVVGQYISRLQLLQLEVVKEIQSFGDRPQPFGVVFTGESAQMKTWLCRWAFFMFAKVANSMNLDAPAKPSEYIYSKNPTENFWTNFNSTKWCILLDDIASTKSDRQKDVPSDMRDFLRVQNNVPFTPEQASLDKKGMTPMKNLLTIGTSNVEHLNVTHYFVHAYAQLRRWNLMVRVQLKDEYLTNGILDKSKIPHSITEYDLWTFTVYRPVPAPHGKVTFQYDEPITSFAVFSQFFANAIKSHIMEQQGAVDALDALSSVSICDDCFQLGCAGQCDMVIQEQGDWNWIPKGYDVWNAPSFSLPPAANCKDRVMEYIAIIALFLYWFTMRNFCYCMKMVLGIIFIPCGTTSTHSTLLEYLSRLEFGAASYVLNFLFWKVSRRLRASQFRVAAVANILVMLGGIYGVYRCVRSLIRKKDNIDIDEQGNIPTAMKERDEVWFNSEPGLHMSELSKDIRTTGNCSIERFVDKVYTNIFRGVAISGDECSNFQAICLGGHIYLTNRHHFNIPRDGIRLGNFLSGSGVRPDKYFPLQSFKMYGIPGTDLMFLYIKDLPPCRDISGFLLEKALDKPTSGVSVMRRDDGYKKLYPLTNLTSGVLRHPSATWSSNREFHSVYGKLTGQLTEAGDCGMPLFAKVGDFGCALLGIHVGVNEMNKFGFSQVLLKSDFAQAMEYFGVDFIVQSGIPSLSLEGESVQLTPMHRKSPLLFIEKGCGRLYGTLPGFRQQPKSQVRRTIVHGELVIMSADMEPPHVSGHGAPCMQGYVPKRRALMDVFGSSCSYDTAVLEECVRAYIDDIRAKLDPKQLSSIEVYTDEVAVNGCAGVTYVDAMKRKTSAGYPWRKSKRFILEECDPLPFAPDAVTFNDEVWRRVRHIEQCLSNGERAVPVFTAHLKDEPVSVKKIQAKKTRVFSGVPVDFAIVMRKYLLSVVRVIQNNRFIFEAGAGTIVQSDEWHKIYEFLVQHGEDRIVAGDYAAFDKSMTAGFILAAFDILIALCKLSGNYSDSDLKCVATIGRDVAFPMTDFFGDLVMFYGSNPSGHPLTVIINGLVNSLYMRYCYYLLNPKKEVKTFQRDVALMTYGDDNIFGVSPNAPWFNHTSIRKVLGEMGMEYTMADKEQISVPYISIWEATFLKRSFRYDEEIGAVLCPLDFKSINKSLLWGMRSSLDERYYALTKLRDACREFFYYGRDIFQERRAFYLCVAELRNLGEVCPISGGAIMTLNEFFPTYEDEVEVYREHCRKLHH